MNLNFRYSTLVTFFQVLYLNILNYNYPLLGIISYRVSGNNHTFVLKDVQYMSTLVLPLLQYLYSEIQ